MLRLLSIRNFAVVEKLDLELEPGFTVLTGETGAGKSILLDALALLLGSRFETRQLRPGADRAELAAEFDLDDGAAARGWLAEQDFVDDGPLLLRRTLDAQGRSRAWINGRPATLAQLAGAGATLVDLHGQHDHESLARPETQRTLLDAFGGFAALAREVASAWRSWREAAERRAVGERDAAALAAEHEMLARLDAEMAALGATEAEWRDLNAAQSRLGHAERLLQAAASAEAELVEGDAALDARVAAIVHRLRQVASYDASLGGIATLLEEARIRLDEAGRALRAYREGLDLNPEELVRVDERLAAIHAMARKHRVPPEGLPALSAQTRVRLDALARGSNAQALARAEAHALASYRALAEQLSAKRRLAAMELGHRVTSLMKELAMIGGRFEVAVSELSEPASFGLEAVAFQVAAHPKQPIGPLASVASGGELSRLALAIQVVLADVTELPTLVFDEVDVGIGGAVAATVGRMLKQLGMRRQVLCVTHLPQVAACADGHFRVLKRGRADNVATALVRLDQAAKIEELARMLGGHEITARTRAHARELLAQHQRQGPRAS